MHIDFLLLAGLLIPYFLIVVSNELLDKHTKLPREVHRKYGHILSGILIITATYFLNFNEMLLYSVALIIGALGTKIFKIKTVHQITRKSIGTSLFALVTLILTLLWFKTHPDMMRYGILILTVPDALAALIGSQYGKQIPKFEKSYLGSAVFFAGMVLITSFFTASLTAIFLISALITALEFFSRWGMDNLTMPLVGSLALFLLM